MNLNKLEELIKRRNKVGSIGALDTLIKLEQKKRVDAQYPTNYTPFTCKAIEVDQNLEKYKRPPSNFPSDIKLGPIEGLANDFSHLERELLGSPFQSNKKVSIVILTYNRSKPLSKTLAGIALQSYPKELIEVIVTDDGSTDDTIEVIKRYEKLLDVKYVWHRDVGFTPAAARNNGIRMARNDLIILLDVDMFPSKQLVENYVKYAPVMDRAVIIGPRKYIDINKLDDSEILKNDKIEQTFKEVLTNNSVANKIEGEKSIDWRLETFAKTANLKYEKLPFRTFASGNVAFSRRAFLEIGCFEERFNTWGYEDTELGFRFFNDGKYFIAAMDAWAYHQEPEGGENETDRSTGKIQSGELFGQLCPYYRRLTTRKLDFEVPTVSIYIPAFNAENTICDAIDSALKQTYQDLEVCVCDDGSTDSTREKLEKYFSNHPRVRWISQRNGGIGSASNTAVKLTRGIYVGQLDSDDYLARDVVEKCVSVFERDISVGLVYTSYENEYPDGRIEPGYNYPVFNREKLLTAMIIHHFRMFRRQYWSRTEGFSTRLKNAVDYDMYLKLAEVCNATHLNIRGYRRRLHGGNTSIVDFDAQIKNAAAAINESLKRLSIPFAAKSESSEKPQMILQKSA